MKNKIFQEKNKIIENIKISESFYLMRFKTSHHKIQINPGQFINIRILNTFDPLLRRPFSIFDFKDGILSILYKIQGRGTKILSQLKSGDTIDYIFPLGNGFKDVFIKDNIWLVTGGVGIAGIFYLLKFIEDKNIKLFAGFNLLDNAIAIKELLKKEKIIAEEDIKISVIKKQNEFFVGDILKLLQENLKKEKPEIIVGCGPIEMLKSLYDIASHLKISTEFLMEKQMGCGIGACFGCALKVRENEQIKIKLVCKDGPVFKGNEIVWI